MDCQTIKPGVACAFMTKRGCTFNGGACHSIIDRCESCARILDLPTGRYCATFADPAAKWRYGECNLATHVVKATVKTDAKLNPLKASKRKGH